LGHSKEPTDNHQVNEDHNKLHHFSISNWPPVWGLKDVELFVKYGKEVVCFEEVSGGKYL